MSHYDPINPVSATIYANDARAKIKDILSRNKTPIIEGGSPFYIHQIFNPNLTNFNDPTFKEARQVARRIIELDGNNF
jgi:tRNA A37 N6-isopentenylltransferase MiaA